MLLVLELRFELFFGLWHRLEHFVRLCIQVLNGLLEMSSQHLALEFERRCGQTVLKRKELTVQMDVLDLPSGQSLKEAW